MFWLILQTILFLWIFLGEEGFDDVYWGYSVFLGCLFVAQITFTTYQIVLNKKILTQELFTMQDQIKIYEAYRGITHILLLVLMFVLRAWSFFGELVLGETDFWPFIAIGIGIFVQMGYWSIVFFTRVCYLCERRQLQRNREELRRLQVQ